MDGDDCSLRHQHPIRRAGYSAHGQKASNGTMDMANGCHWRGLHAGGDSDAGSTGGDAGICRLLFFRHTDVRWRFSALLGAENRGGTGAKRGQWPRKADMNTRDERIMIVIPSSTLDELNHSLTVAADALTPLANGALISQDAQMSLSTIGLIALRQARSAVQKMMDTRAVVLPN